MPSFRSLAALVLVPAALVVVSAGLALAGDLEDAKALQQAGKFEEALPKYQAAAQADPASPEAALGLSQVLTGLGRYDEAAKAVDAARRAHPENAALLAAKGRAYFMAMVKAKAAEEPDDAQISGFHDDAVRWAKEAMKLDQKCVEALLLRGLLWQDDGNDEQARLFFEQATAADPSNFDAAFELANHWYKQADANKASTDSWSKAEAGFLACIRIDPKSARAAANLAHCKAWQKEPKKDVCEAYQRALALAPDDEKLLKNVFNWSPVEERAATMQKLVDAVPGSVMRKIYLAFALSAAKQHEKALEVLEAASKLDAKNPYVPLNEGDVKLAWGKNDDAVDSYLEAMSLFKTKGAIDNDVYLRLAWNVAYKNASLTEGQREKVWAGLTGMFPDRADAAANAGLWFRDEGKDIKKSVEWYLKAVKAAPDDAAVENDTGCVYHYYVKDLDKAEPYYRKAVKIGNANGYDCNKGSLPDVGFRDAINNLYKILVEQKRWKDLKEFAENDVPKTHPLRELWIKEGEEKKK